MLRGLPPLVPKCGSDDIALVGGDDDEGPKDVTDTVECYTCGWAVCRDELD